MINMPLGTFWAIWPQAWPQLEQLLFTAWRGIGSGPVDDAERAGLPVQKHGNLAVIPIRGPIMKHESAFLSYFGIASSKLTQRAVESATADADVEKIVLNIDSPGGSVDGLAELVDALQAARAEKTVIAQVSGMAASAAYMIASQADQIFAGRMDLIGSIGTRMLIYDFSKMFEKEGIKAIPIDTGEHKSAGAFGTEITDAQIAEFQRITDGFFDDFVAAIVAGRGLSEEKVRAVGDGRVFFAEEAITLGLIDGIQTF